MDPIIAVDNLSVHYGDVHALEKVHLSVNPGDYIAIIGENGSGKSTLLKTILGFIKPAQGKVTFALESRTAIGYVPQHTGFDRRFPISVIETVLTGLLTNRFQFMKRFTSHDHKQARSVLVELGLDHLEHRQIGELSGGQLQRVLIARALVSEPDLLILDEPTASIDQPSKQVIYNLLQKLHQERHKTILLVTHDKVPSESTVNKLVVMNKTVLYQGSPAGYPRQSVTTDGVSL